jgi:hypothetical protein
VNTTQHFFVFHRTNSGIRNYSNAHFMFSNKHPQYQRKDWLSYHATSKTWSGAFAQIPSKERVKKPVKKQRKKKKAGWDPEDEDAFEEPADVGKDDAEEQPKQDDEDSIVAGAEDVEISTGKLFRREQVQVRYLVDMLHRYGRAWDRQPSFLGNPAPRVVVIDPFCGSCSTARAAWATDCQFIGMDIDPMAKHLFHGSTEDAKSMKTSTWAKMVAKIDDYPKVHSWNHCFLHSYAHHTPTTYACRDTLYFRITPTTKRQ